MSIKKSCFLEYGLRAHEGSADTRTRHLTHPQTPCPVDYVVGTDSHGMT